LLFEFGAIMSDHEGVNGQSRTRSRRVADREVDHVIEHRIVPLGAPQETNDEVYRQGPGWELDGRYLFALEESWAANDVKEID